MAAETAQQFALLEAQAQVLMSVFTKAGHESVAPAVIQPADVFLDCIGESLRARTYVFTDPDGAELCLRPDLTVPACRLHIARQADPATPAKYCYNGPAFRFQPQGADDAHPREFRQAGIERFGDQERERAEAETIALLLKALAAAGLKDWTLQIGDLGLFRSVLNAAQLPSRWQKRMSDAFWRPEAFRTELQRLITAPGAAAKALPAELVRALTPGDIAASASAVQGYLDRNAISIIGTRTVEEMAEHLLDVSADMSATPLDAASAALIDAYVGVRGPAQSAGATIGKLLAGTKGGTGAALDAYDRRLALLANAGVPLDRVTFSAEFGRNLEYYTGLVFEVLAPMLGAQSPVAGGGRYDGLMRAAGASVAVPAVGGAIHTERLLSVLNGGRS
ncbi:MAG: ATP phosphoribosyltransferase regulatory subunit [Hyphomicrobium sp.]